MSQIAFGTKKFLFCAFLNTIDMLDFMSECAQHLDQKEQKKVLFCQKKNCMIKRTREKCFSNSTILYSKRNENNFVTFISKKSLLCPTI